MWCRSRAPGRRSSARRYCSALEVLVMSLPFATMLASSNRGIRSPIPPGADLAGGLTAPSRRLNSAPRAASLGAAHPDDQLHAGTGERLPGPYVIGVDIGGTFTDVAMLDGEPGEQWFAKTESTPAGFEAGVVRGITGILAQTGRSPEDCAGFVHGTTLALNAILTRSGARLGLLTTEGFGDVLEIGRLQMPDPFNLYTHKPVPLVRRQFVAEVAERVLGSGDVLTPLREEGVREAAAQLVGMRVDAIAICFINGYKNPAHEIAAAEIVRRHHPTVSVSRSSEVWPEIREYERAMVTVMNAYVAPKVRTYLDSLQERVDETRLAGPLHVTTSNGDMLPPRLVKERHGTTLLSGPAAGVIPSAQLSETCGLDKVRGLYIGGAHRPLSPAD